MSQRSLQEQIDKAHNLCAEWIDNRKEVRRELLNLADKLNEHQKNVNIAKVSGSSAGVVGAGLAIGGFAASFFTFGASLILSAVGAGIAGAGGITAVGAGIAKQIIDNKIFKDVQKCIERDEMLMNKLNSQIKKINGELGSIKIKGLRKLELNLGGLGKIAFKAGKQSFGIKKIVYDPINTANAIRNPARLSFAAADLATDAGLNVFKVLSTTGKALHIGGFVLGMIALPLDIATIVTSSIELNKGNVTEAEKKLRDVANGMFCPNKNEIPYMLKEYVEELINS